ncbi:MAG: hypothetical protein Alpg2KO_04600 [Alphaproteobacteria bacterium]
MRRHLAIGSSDSQLRPALNLARACAEPGDQIIAVVHPSRNSVSRAQLKDLGVKGSVETRNYKAQARDALISAVDVVYPVLAGSEMREFIDILHRHHDWSQHKKRPLVVTGYGGIVYEKHLEGLMWRIGSDVIAVNSLADQRLFAELGAKMGHSDLPLVAMGFNALQKEERIPLPPADTPVKNILFATQDIVPGNREERRYIAFKLAEYAARFPDRKVIIKPRNRPGENSFHDEKHRFDDLLEEWSERIELPPNLEIRYGPMDEVLAEVDTVLTISSTAVIEAIHLGKRGVVLGDLGVKEGFGNHYFCGSGLIASFADLFEDRLPVMNEDWYRDNVDAPGANLGTLKQSIQELLHKQEQQGSPLPAPDLGYNQTSTPYLADRWRKAEIPTWPLVPEETPLTVKPEPELPPAETIAGVEVDKIERMIRKGRKLMRNPRRFFSDRHRHLS